MSEQKSTQLPLPDPIAIGFISGSDQNIILPVNLNLKFHLWNPEFVDLKSTKQCNEITNPDEKNIVDAPLQYATAQSQTNLN